MINKPQFYFLALACLFIQGSGCTSKNNAPNDTVQPQPTLPMSPNPQVSTSPTALDADAQLARGKVVFETNCATCHGITGEGNGVAAAAINPKPRNFTTGIFKYGSSRDEIFKTISTGVAGTAMPSWAALPESDRRAVIEYVLKFKK